MKSRGYSRKSTSASNKAFGFKMFNGVNQEAHKYREKPTSLSLQPYYRTPCFLVFQICSLDSDIHDSTSISISLPPIRPFRKLPSPELGLTRVLAKVAFIGYDLRQALDMRGWKCSCGKRGLRGRGRGVKRGLRWLELGG